MSKRYYWLKLNENFFEREEIKIIEDMPNGVYYINFYLKLLLKSIKTEGELMFRGVIPYTPEMLSSITNTDVDTVRVAIDLFSKLNLLKILDDGALFMLEIENMVGSESSSAERVRKHRAKKKLEEQKALQCNSDEINCNTELNKELELEKELEKDTDNTTSPTKVEPPIPYKEIIDYLNAKAKRQFRYGKANQRHITARWNEGYRLEDFKRVIDTKVDDWGKDSNMGRFLRPETLFGSKFEGYVNERPTVDTPDNLNDRRLDRYEKY